MLAIIPARLGSKRLPRKNLRELDGRPLLAWVIGAAHAAERVSRVIVSTEAEEIAEVARREGAELVMRPHKLAGDKLTARYACLHAFDEATAGMESKPDAFVHLQVTNPLTSAGDIDAICAEMKDPSCPGVTTMTPARFHAEGFYRRDETGAFVNLAREWRGGAVPEMKPSQLHGARFELTGAATGLRVNSLRRDINYIYFVEGLRGVVTPQARAIDIDNELDLKIAEVLLAVLRDSGTGTT